MQKEIVVLANSIKHKNHCVAGKCLNTGEWIRPVGSSSGKELTNTQVLVKNNYGNYPVKLLQKVIIEFIDHVPLAKHQPENYLISNKIWQQNFRIDQSYLTVLLDHPDNIWGLFNRVAYDQVIKGNHGNGSLLLIQVKNMNLSLNKFGKRRAVFNYKNNAYDLPVTDPNFDNLYKDMVSYENAILTISLGA